MGGIGSSYVFVATLFGDFSGDRFFAEFEGVGGIESDYAMVFHIDEGRAAVDSRNSKVGIEAKFERSWFQVAIPVGLIGAESEMPLPYNCGVVSRVLKQFGKRRKTRIDGEALLGADRSPKIVAMRVAASQQAIA